MDDNAESSFENGEVIDSNNGHSEKLFQVSFLARYVRRQKELQRAKTNAANSVQLAMQRFGLILGHRRSASAIAMKPVKTKGASQERASAAQPEGRIW